MSGNQSESFPLYSSKITEEGSVDALLVRVIISGTLNEEEIISQVMEVTKGWTRFSKSEYEALNHCLGVRSTELYNRIGLDYWDGERILLITRLSIQGSENEVTVDKILKASLALKKEYDDEVVKKKLVQLERIAIEKKRKEEAEIKKIKKTSETELDLLNRLLEKKAKGLLGR